MMLYPTGYPDVHDEGGFCSDIQQIEQDGLHLRRYLVGSSQFCLQLEEVVAIKVRQRVNACVR